MAAERLFIQPLQYLFPCKNRFDGMESQIYYEAAVVIISFILLGRYLEERARSKTSSAIRKLVNLGVKNRQSNT